MSGVRRGWRARRGRWWWIAALILVPVVLGSALAVALLLALVDAATVGDQIDLIKTGLAIGAGTGGAVGLVLAGRRQWSTEQAHRVTEQSAADARHDATERRITDLYSKAADQLGSDKAAVRLAGLYSLERLAQDNPPLRQTVVNLLCAYLRMPSESASEQEIEVRRAAQRIFATHLRVAYGPLSDTFWHWITLDLTGAVLHLFELKDAQLREGRFGGARFVGTTWFDGVRFDGDAVFGGATFEKSASFRSARFGGEARFRDAKFAGPADFGGAEFAERPSFDGAGFAEAPVIDPSVELD
jgi:pentapeptide repeat protein